MAARLLQLQHTLTCAPMGAAPGECSSISRCAASARSVGCSKIAVNGRFRPRCSSTCSVWHTIHQHTGIIPWV